MWKRRNAALEGLEQEMRDHLERETEINIARGISPEEARRQARLAFGNVALAHEDARAAWTWAWLEQFRQDLRVGARILTTSPGLSFTAAVLIALVIGINTTIFSMVNGLVTRPAPGVEAKGLVRIALADRPGAGFFSYPDYQDYAAQTTTLQSLTAFTNRRMTVASDRGSAAFNATAVDTNYFETVGMRVIKGRTFTVGEQSGDSSGLVAIISERAWHRHFDNADDIIGRAIAVNGQPATIVGVAPKDFRGTMLMEQSDPTGPGEINFLLRHGAGRFDTVAAAIGPALREVDSSVPIVFVRTMSAQLEGVTLTARMIARLLTIFSLVSLLIAAIGQYAVVAFSIRRRVREFGVRIALGASARQVLAAVLGEGFALTAVGLVAGLLLSLGVAAAARGSLFGVTPTDPRTYGGVFIVLAVVALVACCLPARAATRVDPVAALRQE